MKPKQAGDLGVFRYVDADSYDPDLKEIFVGIIIDVKWTLDEMPDAHYVSPGDEDGIPAPIYSVMCTDGQLRNFPHWELFGPVDDIYDALLDKGSRFQEVAGEEE
jgi:hypothetical protein